MAKRAGAEEPAPKGPANAGSNQVVTPEYYLKAVKDITAQRAVVDAARARLNAIRKEFKAGGIVLGTLDAMVRMAEWDRGEIRDHFDVQAKYAEWLGLPVAPGVMRQGDAFRGDPASEEFQRAEWKADGRTASRTGKPGRPPEECPPEFHQAWMQGFNEEDEAAWSDAERVEEKAAPVAEAAPRKEPDWSGFSPDPEEWFAAQWRDFRDWYASLPAGAEVRISHEGVLKAFRAERDTPQPDWSAFPAKPAEWTEEQMAAFDAWFDALPADHQRPFFLHPGVEQEYDEALAELSAANAGGSDAEPQPEPAPAGGKGKGGSKAKAALH